MPTVVALADFDLPTRSASGFILRYIAPRVEPVQLISMMVRKEPFQLSAPQSDIIVGVGHGNVSVFTGYKEDILLKVGEYDPTEVRGKVIKLVACRTGIALGPDLVNHGAASFAGYTDDYVWVCDADKVLTPWADDLAAPNLMPVVEGLNVLLDGKTVEEAFQAELEGYTRNAAVEEDELIKACLEFNRDNAILLGNTGARIRARPPLPLPFKLVPPPPMILPIS